MVLRRFLPKRQNRDQLGHIQRRPAAKPDDAIDGGSFGLLDRGQNDSFWRIRLHIGKHLDGNTGRLKH